MKESEPSLSQYLLSYKASRRTHLVITNHHTRSINIHFAVVIFVPRVGVFWTFLKIFRSEKWTSPVVMWTRVNLVQFSFATVSINLEAVVGITVWRGEQIEVVAIIWNHLTVYCQQCTNINVTTTTIIMIINNSSIIIIINIIINIIIVLVIILFPWPIITLLTVSMVTHRDHNTFRDLQDFSQRLSCLD